MILALDCATKVGFACGPIGAQPPLLEYGMRDFGRKDRTNGAIIGLFRGWFAQRVFTLRPQLVVFESPYIPVPRGPFAKPGKSSPPPMNPHTLRRLLGMTGAVEAVCDELRIDCREATTQEFTKFLTGKGRYPGGRDEKKAAVIQACRHLGCEPQDDNAADALAIFFYAESILSPRAAEHRRRLAADRDRELNGAGPLFGIIPDKENAPQAAILRGALSPQGNEENPWSKMTNAT